ncbi:uncharacterized protein NPIL_168061 [Nephila pilipes]|uniref:Uncharacterized protein n=1 Tax=Nephila pilipes TaxID=299642 RepID=A0A8X6T6S7_NEPPI|nr:uncharacterized protein NPIL_168061 [Nephila pilipes]
MNTIFKNASFFSTEATFHVSNKVNKHYCRIWSSENSHAAQEGERNSTKINMRYALSYDTVIRQFFFSEISVAANVYLDMLQIYAITQLQHLHLPTRWAPLPRGIHVRAFLDVNFSKHWIESSGIIT